MLRGRDGSSVPADPNIIAALLGADPNAIEDILRMIQNGFKYAFLPEKDVKRYLDDVEREWEG